MTVYDLLDHLDRAYQPGGPGMTEIFNSDGSLKHDAQGLLGDTLLLFVARELSDVVLNNQATATPRPLSAPITKHDVAAAIGVITKARDDLYALLNELNIIEVDNLVAF